MKHKYIYLFRCLFHLPFTARVLAVCCDWACSVQRYFVSMHIYITNFNVNSITGAWETAAAASASAASSTYRRRVGNACNNKMVISVFALEQRIHINVCQTASQTCPFLHNCIAGRKAKAEAMAKASTCIMLAQMQSPLKPSKLLQCTATMSAVYERQLHVIWYNRILKPEHG